MPAENVLRRRVLVGTQASVNVSLGIVSLLVVGCNGETAFVEQSRNLQREVRIAATDTDQLSRPGSRNSGDVVGEGPAKRNSSPQNEDTSMDGQSNGVDEQHRSRQPGDDRPGNSSGDAVSIPPPQNTPPVTAQPSEPSVPPASAQPPVQSTPPATAQPPVQSTPPVTANPQPPVPSRTPSPRAGDWVYAQQIQPRAKVDILWVVDSSGSMAWAQNQLKNKFQSFAQKLKETRIDFQVGVTSVDVCQVDSGTGYPVADALCPDVSYIPDGVKVGGKVVGPLRGTLQADPTTKRSILRDTSDFVEAFQRTAMLGTKGSAFEHGLWSAKLAVEKALKSGGENQGFVRPDASLSVVVLSDEEDDSVQMWCEDAYGRTSLTADGKKDLNLCREGGNSPFLDAFGIAPYALMKTAKGMPMTTHKFTADQFKAWASGANVKGQGNFRVSAITGLRKKSGDIDCSMSSGGPEESGTNYIKAAQLTGGVVENICSPDWSSVLTNIGQNTVELATRVSLPAGRIPFPGTLEVKVDGQVLDAMQYTYDTSLHAVVFKVPPGMGAEVNVSYRETLVD